MNASDETGTSLLGLAARKGHLATFKLLLEAGANPTVKDLEGRDPLELARTRGYMEIVELLSRFDAELNPAVTSIETAPDSDGAAESEGGLWEAEASPREPAWQPGVHFPRRSNRDENYDFEYLSPDEDWDDVDADLPTYQLFAGIRKREFHVLRSELLRFFGSAIVAGTVTAYQLQLWEMMGANSTKRRVSA